MLLEEEVVASVADAERVGGRGGSWRSGGDWLDPVDKVARSEAELLLVVSMALDGAPIHSR